MEALGPHATFIVASYVVVAVVLFGIIAWLILDGRAQKRQLAEMEARGIRRRSGRHSK